MYARRKNGETARPKRVSRRSKLCEVLQSSYVQHTKVVFLWMLFLFMNYSTGMRMEYFWPGWLFLCSINESLRFEGLHFALVFVLIVLATDLICFFVIPVTWVFLFGSAYVWIYLLWHIDRGICLPTCVLFIIFMYFELEFRSKEHKYFQNSIYLFRPFAAHCIGYPAVCIGFSVKNYLEVKYRTRKRLDVRAENAVYYRLLEDALRPDMQAAVLVRSLASHDEDFDESRAFNEVKLTSASSCFLNGELEYRSPLVDNSLAATLFYPFTCPSGKLFDPGQFLCNIASCLAQLPVVRTFLVLARHSSAGPVSSSASTASLSAEVSGQQSLVPPSGVEFTDSGRPEAEAETSSFSSRRNVSLVGSSGAASCEKAKLVAKEFDVNAKLEATLRKLRGDIHSIKAAESQLRLQLNQVESDQRHAVEWSAVQRQQNDELTAEITRLTAQNRADRLAATQLDAQAAEERRLCEQLEKQLKRLREAPAELPLASEDSPRSSQQQLSAFAKASAKDGPASQSCVGETGRLQCLCSDECAAICAKKRRKLDQELRLAQNQLRHRDENLCSLSAKVISQPPPALSGGRGLVSELPPLLGGAGGVEHCHHLLQSYIKAATEDRTRLSGALREENMKHKELHSLYHKTVSEMNELRATIRKRDSDISHLKQKIEQYETMTRNGNGNGVSSAGRSSSTLSQPQQCAAGGRVRGWKDSTRTQYDFSMPMETGSAYQMSPSELHFEQASSKSSPSGFAASQRAGAGSGGDLDLFDKMSGSCKSNKWTTDLQMLMNNVTSPVLRQCAKSALFFEQDQQ